MFGTDRDLHGYVGTQATWPDDVCSPIVAIGAKRILALAWTMACAMALLATCCCFVGVAGCCVWPWGSWPGVACPHVATFAQEVLGFDYQAGKKKKKKVDNGVIILDDKIMRWCW